MKLLSINPANGEEINSYAKHSFDEVQYILSQVSEEQTRWEKVPLNFRQACLEQLAGILRDKAKEYGQIISLEMGKPISQSISEVEKCAWLCDYYREMAPSFLEDKIENIEGQKSIVSVQPIGIVLGIMPWNFPFWQVFRFVVPTITAGNGAVLKHASNVQGAANAIQTCFKESGFPENIFKNLSISGNEVERVIKHSSIDAVTFTGSTPVGKSIAKTAGSVLKKTVLELGGSDPFIILDDANINRAVDGSINGRLLNGGQSCIAAKRIIVTKKLYEEFSNLLKQKLSEKIMGDPMDDVDLGPMVSIEARSEIHHQVLCTIEEGGRLELGGEIPSETGAYYPITMIKDVKPGMTGFDEEIFGPVFILIRAENNEDAIRLGNLTKFGLGAAIFTSDIGMGEQIAKIEIKSGTCYVNDFVKSDPRLPFGGIKESGYGRELSSYGMLEFVNIKSVVIKEA